MVYLDRRERGGTAAESLGEKSCEMAKDRLDVLHDSSDDGAFASLFEDGDVFDQGAEGA